MINYKNYARTILIEYTRKTETVKVRHKSYLINVLRGLIIGSNTKSSKVHKDISGFKRK